jgi:hypothetical protein
VIGALILLVLGGTAFAGYVVGTHDDEEPRQDATCIEAVGREKELLSQAKVLADAVPESTPLGGSGDRVRAQDRVRRVIEEAAILVQQNPTCFSPTERAQIEALNRQWNPSAP